MGKQGALQHDVSLFRSLTSATRLGELLKRMDVLACCSVRGRVQILCPQSTSYSRRIQFEFIKFSEHGGETAVRCGGDDHSMECKNRTPSLTIYVAAERG